MLSVKLVIITHLSLSLDQFFNGHIVYHDEVIFGFRIFHF